MKEWLPALLVAAVGIVVLIWLAQFMAGTFGNPDAPTITCPRSSTQADCL